MPFPPRILAFSLRGNPRYGLGLQRYSLFSECQKYAMRFERNDYKIDSRTAEAGPKTFDRRTGSFCQSRPYRSRRAVGKSRTGNSPGLVGRAMEMIGRAGTLRIKRHFFRPVARFFLPARKKDVYLPHNPFTRRV